MIISLLLSFCSIQAKAIDREIQVAGNVPEKFAPLGHLDGSLLFKAGFSVFGDYYSGLVLIKEMPDSGAIHIVFLSELGLNLLDLSYYNDEFEVENVQEFLNRPSLLKTLQKDFRCLLLDLSEIQEFRIKEKDDGDTEMLKFRHRSQRYKYTYNAELGPCHIARRSGLFGKVDFHLDAGKPRKIAIDHRGIRLKIVLTELKRQ